MVGLESSQRVWRSLDFPEKPERGKRSLISCLTGKKNYVSPRWPGKAGATWRFKSVLCLCLLDIANPFYHESLCACGSLCLECYYLFCYPFFYPLVLSLNVILLERLTPSKIGHLLTLNLNLFFFLIAFNIFSFICLQGYCSLCFHHKMSAP